MILQNKVLKELIKAVDLKRNAITQYLHVSSNSVLVTNSKILLVISEDDVIEKDFKKVEVNLLKSKMALDDNVELSEIANGDSNIGCLLEYFKSDNSDCVVIECKTKNPIYYDAKELLKVQNILTSLGWKMNNLEILSYNRKLKSIIYKAKIDNYCVYFTVCGILF